MNHNRKVINLNTVEPKFTLKNQKQLEIEKIVSKNELDFLLNPTLMLVAKDVFGKEIYRRSLASYIGPDHVNTHVVEIKDAVFNIGTGITTSLEHTEEDFKFDVELVYRIND